MANQAEVLNQTMPYVAAFNEPGEPAIDLNGDGEGDLLYQNTSTGQFAYVWLDAGQGAAYGSNASSIQSLPSGYSIVAMGDLAGNGLTDLVLSNSSNAILFLMSNGDGTFTSVAGPNVPAGFRIVGAGDINGDGYADLVFENDTTHQVQYWLMNGTASTAIHTLNFPSGWYVMGIDDLWGNGRADLVWSHGANGVYVTEINDDYSLNQASTGASYGQGWRFVGSGDVNGDGYADLIFENDTTHQIEYWLMDGATRKSYLDLSLPSGYEVALVNRLSGGTVSLLLTSNARDTYVWQNDGHGNFSSSTISAFPASSAGTYYANYPSGWNIVSSTPAQP
ncbi:hypothetical protein HY57_01985 [Dyella japonica A8]|uniref:VCBS repeat-containing protein n=1 Tax=Dyella japonica A8 TaxID=1217721 RepID=A0A075JX52_9GAMM|nr:hypothetical protein HY57_01985 [Dyella japonica A8]